jgi:putative CocE/NonD family hydrolase
MHYLKGTPDPKTPNVMVFETGTNVWRKYNTWPAALAVQRTIFLNAGNKLSFDKPKPDKEKFNEFISDPAKPVRYTAKVAVERGSDFMVEDQRFTSGRSDVLSFQSELLNTDVTLSGPVKADLFVSTTGTDADFVVKIIDIYPENYAALQPGVEKKMDGYQQLVRGEIMRSKFRKSFAAPEPMIPGKITEVEWDMEDVNHCFLKGHRIMIQIQSSWFPLNDRNPQTFTDIYKADETQFHKAVHRIYFSPNYPSHINVLTITPH